MQGRGQPPAGRHRTSSPPGSARKVERPTVGDDDGLAHGGRTGGGHVDGGTRSSAARSTSTAWGRSSCRGRLRWMRSPRSTCASASDAKIGGHVDQEAQLHPVAAGEAELLEDPAVGRRLAGQRLAHPGQLGEEQLEHRPGHQLGDPAAARGLTVEGTGVEALDQRDVLGGEQRAQESGDEGRGRVGHVHVEEHDDVARRRGQCGAHGLSLAATAPRAGHHPGPGACACSAVSSSEPSSSTITSSTRPLPPWGARNGCTTTRTTDPTVEPSSRAGMQTKTLRPVRPLASATRAVGKSPW